MLRCTERRHPGETFGWEARFFFFAMLQVVRHHRVRQILPGWEAEQRTHVRDDALRHSFSRTPCTKIPVRNETHIVPGGQLGRWFDGEVVVKLLAVSRVTGRESA